MSVLGFASRRHDGDEDLWQNLPPRGALWCGPSMSRTEPRKGNGRAPCRRIVAGDATHPSTIHIVVVFVPPHDIMAMTHTTTIMG